MEKNIFYQLLSIYILFSSLSNHTNAMELSNYSPTEIPPYAASFIELFKQQKIDHNNFDYTIDSVLRLIRSDPTKISINELKVLASFIEKSAIKGDIFNLFAALEKYHPGHLHAQSRKLFFLLNHILKNPFALNIAERYLPNYGPSFTMSTGFDAAYSIYAVVLLDSGTKQQQQLALRYIDFMLEKGCAELGYVIDQLRFVSDQRILASFFEKLIIKLPSMSNQFPWESIQAAGALLYHADYHERALAYINTILLLKHFMGEQHPYVSVAIALLQIPNSKKFTLEFFQKNILTNKSFTIEEKLTIIKNIDQQHDEIINYYQDVWHIHSDDNNRIKLIFSIIDDSRLINNPQLNRFVIPQINHYLSQFDKILAALKPAASADICYLINFLLNLDEENLRPMRELIADFIKNILLSPRNELYALEWEKIIRLLDSLGISAEKMLVDLSKSSKIESGLFINFSRHLPGREKFLVDIFRSASTSDALKAEILKEITTRWDANFQSILDENELMDAISGQFFVLPIDSLLRNQSFSMDRSLAIQKRFENTERYMKNYLKNEGGFSSYHTRLILSMLDFGTKEQLQLAVSYIEHVLEKNNSIVIDFIKELIVVSHHRTIATLLDKFIDGLFQKRDQYSWDSIHAASLFFNHPHYHKHALTFIKDTLRLKNFMGDHPYISVTKTLMLFPNSKKFAIEFFEKNILPDSSFTTGEKLLVIKNMHHIHKMTNYCKYIWNNYYDDKNRIELIFSLLNNSQLKEGSELNKFLLKGIYEYLPQLDKIFTVLNHPASIHISNLINFLFDVDEDSFEHIKIADFINDIFQTSHDELELLPYDKLLMLMKRAGLSADEILRYARNSRNNFMVRKNIIYSLKNDKLFSQHTFLAIQEQLLALEEKITTKEIFQSKNESIFLPHMPLTINKLKFIIEKLLEDFYSYQFDGTPFQKNDVIKKTQAHLADDELMKKALGELGKEQINKTIKKAKKNVSILENDVFWNQDNTELATITIDGRTIKSGQIYSLFLYYIERQQNKPSYVSLVGGLVQALASSEAMKGCQTGAMSQMANSTFKDEFNDEIKKRSYRDYSEVVRSKLLNLKTIAIYLLSHYQNGFRTFDINNPLLTKYFPNIQNNEFLIEAFHIFNQMPLEKIFDQNINSLDKLFLNLQNFDFNPSREEQNLVKDVYTLIIEPSLLALLAKEYSDFIIFKSNSKEGDKLSFPDFVKADEEDEILPYNQKLIDEFFRN